jgi:hypothetical protein
MVCSLGLRTPFATCDRASAAANDGSGGWRSLARNGCRASATGDDLRTKSTNRMVDSSVLAPAGVSMVLPGNHGLQSILAASHHSGEIGVSADQDLLETRLIAP